MTVSPVQRLVLRGFPPRFRDRYGAELAALASDRGGGWRDTLDLARAAASAWVRPTFSGAPAERRRQRLQATTATVFFVWSLAALSVAVFARAVDDRPVPGLRSWGWTAYAVGSAVFQVTVAAALVVGFGYWLLVVIPAWRRGDRRTLLDAALPAALVAVWLGGTGLVALYARHRTESHSGYQTWRLPGAGPGVVLGLYAAFTVACVVGCALAATRALARAHLGQRALEVAALLSAGASVALVAVTAAGAVCLGRVLAVGGIAGRNTAMAVTPTVLLVVASVLAVASSLRGLRELAPGDDPPGTGLRQVG